MTPVAWLDFGRGFLYQLDETARYVFVFSKISGPQKPEICLRSVIALSFPSFNQKTLPLQHIGVNQFPAHPVA